MSSNFNQLETIKSGNENNILFEHVPLSVKDN